MKMQPKAFHQAAEQGFSIVEMLLAAFILGVGILGVAMLQTLALSNKGVSQNLMAATHLCEGIMDQIEDEGRNTWLNISSTRNDSPASMSNLAYFLPVATPPAGVPEAKPVPDRTQYYNNECKRLESDTGAVYTANISSVSSSPTNVGSMADVKVTVQFTSDSKGTRKVTLTRRILYGKQKAVPAST